MPADVRYGSLRIEELNNFLAKIMFKITTKYISQKHTYIIYFKLLLGSVALRSFDVPSKSVNQNDLTQDHSKYFFKNEIIRTFFSCFELGEFISKKNLTFQNLGLK